MFPDEKYGDKECCCEDDHCEAKEPRSQCSPLVEENLLDIVDFIGDSGSVSGRFDDIECQLGLPSVILDPRFRELDAFFAVGKPLARNRFQLVATPLLL